MRVPSTISLPLFLSGGRFGTGEAVNHRVAMYSSRCRATSSCLHLPATTFILTSRVRIPLLFSGGGGGDGVGFGEVRRRRLVLLYLLAFGVELLYIVLGFVFCIGDLVGGGGIVFRLGASWFTLSCLMLIFCWVPAIG